MITKDNIIEAINEPQLGPLHLEYEYKKLTDDRQQEEFLSIIKDLARSGSDKERIASFTIMEIIGKVKDCEDVIKQNIESLNFSESSTLINSLLWVAAGISQDWSIAFIQQVIEQFKPKSIEYSYLFNMGIRSIVVTKYWENAIGEIKWIIRNYSDDFVVDFLAYFIWKRGEVEFEKLLHLIDDDSILISKIEYLKSRIKIRYISNYRKIV
jgi:hypothetical protein